MGEAEINFGEFSWDKSGAGVRSKAVVRKGRKLRLVEFTGGFADLGWCERVHTGYVLDGELTVAFPDRVGRFTAGDGFMIFGVGREPHKAEVTGAGARPILMDDANE